MKKEMTDRVALVTGASSGIGRAAALAFAMRGAKVVVNSDKNMIGGQETVSMIKKAGGEAIFIKGDVSITSQAEALIKKTVEAYGRLDYAYNNAGVEGHAASIVDLAEEEWDRVMSINLKGMWLCMKYEIPQMLKQGGGAIVNVSSIAGLQAEPEGGAYAVSKHGVIGLTQTAAVEYAKAGIRVNAVCPGIIATPMIDRLSGGDLEGARQAQAPIERLGRPEEIAEAVVWLCSEAASFVNGHALVVDGGKTILTLTPGRAK